MCYLTCPEGSEFVWDDPTRPAWKTRAAIECKGTGIWQVSQGFSCGQPCPELTNLNKDKYVVVRHEWETGFELLFKFTPTVDLQEWTLVFQFKEALTTNVEFHCWEAQMTVSANGRIATLTNWNWNVGIKAGETYRMIFVVTGASRFDRIIKCSILSVTNYLQFLY